MVVIQSPKISFNLNGGYMKKSNDLLRLASLTLMISIVGFGAGCGNSNNLGLSGNHISISNLSPTEKTFQHDSGTTTVTLTFNATDFSQNPTVYWTLLDNTGKVIQSTSSIVQASSPSVITVTVNVNTSQLVAGSSGSYRVYMTDETGGISNVLGGSWSAS